MEKYLIQSKNKSYFQLEKMKDKLGRAKHLEYLYELDHVFIRSITNYQCNTNI